MISSFLIYLFKMPDRVIWVEYWYFIGVSSHSYIGHCIQVDQLWSFISYQSWIYWNWSHQSVCLVVRQPVLLIMWTRPSFFWLRMFIFGTMIAYDKERVKGQGQIYIKSVLWLITCTPLFLAVTLDSKVKVIFSTSVMACNFIVYVCVFT